MRRLLALAALSACLPAAALENPAVTAAPVLLLPVGTRAMGMGGAYAALGGDTSALFFNPAGLSLLAGQEASFSHVAGQTDDHIEHVAYGGPLRFTGLSGSGYASFGGSLLYAGKGDIEINRTAADGSLLSEERTNAGWDMVATAAYSERLGVTPIDLKHGSSVELSHFAGASAKILHSTLAGGFSGTAYAADLGYLARAPELGMSLGISASNIGTRLSYVSNSKGDPLPATLRLGLAYQRTLAARQGFTAAVDADMAVHQRLWHVSLGTEYAWSKSYAVRAGYRFKRDTAGFTAGFGAGWNSLVLDYAWSLGRSLSDEHRVSVAYRFGGVAKPARERARRPQAESAADAPAIRGFEDVPSSQTPIEDEPPRRRSAPRRQEKPQGLPGWIY